MFLQESKKFSLVSYDRLYFFNCQFYGEGIIVRRKKVEVLVKIFFKMLTFFQHFNTKFAFCFHDKSKHMIVVITLEQKPTRKQLEKTASNSPSIDTIPLIRRHLTSQNDLRGSVVPGNEILNLSRMLLNRESSTKISEFKC